MASRSRALAKRKADEQLINSRPTKLAKQAPNEGTISENTATAAAAGRNHLRSGFGNVYELSRTPGAAAVQPDDKGAGRSAPSSRSPGDLESQQSPPRNQPLGEQNRQATQAKNEEERSCHDEDHDLVYAKSVLQRLQLIIKRWRLCDGIPLPDSQSDKQMEIFSSLCNLLDQDAKTYGNGYLRTLPFEWLRDMGALHRRLQDLQPKHGSLCDAMEGLGRCSNAFNEASSRRGNAYLCVGDCSREARLILRESVLEARKIWRIAHKAWAEARQAHKQSKDRAWSMVHHVLATAEHALVHNGYLRRWKGEESLTFNQGERKDPRNMAEGDRGPPPTHSRYRRPNRSHDSQPGGRTTETDHRDHIRDQCGREPSPSQRGQDEVQSSVPDIMDGLRRGQRENVERTMTAHDESVRRFDAVRGNYHRNLASSVEKQRRNAVRGTRTAFDHSYFLERGRSSHDVATNREPFELAAEQAGVSGAVADADRLLHHRGEAASQREERDDRVARMLREMADERIEA